MCYHGNVLNKIKLHLYVLQVMKCFTNQMQFLCCGIFNHIILELRKLKKFYLVCYTDLLHKLSCINFA